MKKAAVVAAVLGLFVAATALVGFAQDKKGLSAHDKKFLMHAAMGGMMEVQLGKLAQEKGQSQEVKKLGAMMVADHSKANEELMKLAEQKGVTLPQTLDKEHQKHLDKLTKASAAEFDKEYVRMMVKDHAKDVASFRAAAQKVKDPDLNAWVTKTLPTLEQHQQHVASLAQGMGIDAKEQKQKGKETAEKKEEKKEQKKQQQ